MEVVVECCCGLDVHKATVAACVWRRDARGHGQKAVQTFGTMTADLLVLADWLKAHGVTHVAMESTGVFWQPVYNLLEADFEVLLVNAEHIKRVPGRKTDVTDCEWIADLLAHGLLKGSFIPPAPIRELRDLTRYRKALTDERVREVNRLHKLLQAANLKLSSVASDVLGLSGRRMLDALLAGTTDPAVLAELALGKLRTKLPALQQALQGRFSPHHRVLLAHLLAHLDFLDGAIAELSAEGQERIAPFEEVLACLDTIPGVDRKGAEGTLAEIGVDMTRFPTDGHLAAWTGLCPGNRETAGKRKSGKARKGDVWFRRYAIEMALAASRSQGTYLNALYHRFVRRKGHKKAIVAVAHAMVVIMYHVIKHKVPYYELGADYFDRLNVAAIKRHHVRRLEGLGFKVTLEPLEVAA
jgi:transposase